MPALLAPTLAVVPVAGVELLALLLERVPEYATAGRLLTHVVGALECNASPTTCVRVLKRVSHVAGQDHNSLVALLLRRLPGDLSLYKVCLPV